MVTPLWQANAPLLENALIRAHVSATRRLYMMVVSLCQNKVYTDFLKIFLNLSDKKCNFPLDL